MKSTIYQLARGHELVFKNGVLFNEKENKYHVRSSRKNHFYIIEYQEKFKDLKCECLGFKYNDHCSHLTAIRIYRRTEKK